MASCAEGFKVDTVCTMDHCLLKTELPQLSLHLATPIGVVDLGTSLSLHEGYIRRVALHVAPILATHIVEGVGDLPQRADLAGLHQGRKDVVVSNCDRL